MHGIDEKTWHYELRFLITIEKKKHEKIEMQQLYDKCIIHITKIFLPLDESRQNKKWLLSNNTSQGEKTNKYSRAQI
jgi:hypothetical protein